MSLFAMIEDMCLMNTKMTFARIAVRRLIGVITMTNRHTSYDLKQMQSVPLEGKIIMTKERIRQWYEH